jgi:hypothetical protein
LASLVFTRRIKTPAGVLFDADSVVLRNVANTAGIVRLDTHAVVVAAGTAMPKTSTGVYQYPLTGAIAGVTYRAHVRVTIGSAVYDSSIDAVAPSAVALPSYLTSAEVRSLAPQVFGAESLTSATDAELDRLSAAASSRIDRSRRYEGRRYDPLQKSEFPRAVGYSQVDSLPLWPGMASSAGRYIWDWDAATSAAVVPVDVKLATLHEMASLRAGERSSRLAAQHDGLASQTTGPASESYRPPTSADGLPLVCFEADALLRQYELVSGEML